MTKSKDGFNREDYDKQTETIHTDGNKEYVVSSNLKKEAYQDLATIIMRLMLDEISNK